MFVFTNGMGLTAYDEATVKALAVKVKAGEVRINVIPINFMEGYVIEENQV